MSGTWLATKSEDVTQDVLPPKKVLTGESDFYHSRRRSGVRLLLFESVRGMETTKSHVTQCRRQISDRNNGISLAVSRKSSLEAKPCSLSIDLDPLDHYLTVRGWKPLPNTNLNTIYDGALLQFLDVFSEFNIKATFFVVGKDLLNKNNQRLIKRLSEEGHEIANHTMNHIQDFVSLEKNKKRSEIEEMARRASDLIGKPITGFRAPGWNIDIDTIDILEERGYCYDSSVFPSFFIPLLKLVHFHKNRGRGASCFGKPFLICAAPRGPYFPSVDRIWKRGNRSILEIPPSVLPVVRFPFFGTLIFQLGVNFFIMSFSIFRLSSLPLVYELHGIELADYDDIGDERLRVKPGLTWPLKDKIDVYKKMITLFKNGYRFMPMQELAFEYTI